MINWHASLRMILVIRLRLMNLFWRHSIHAGQEKLKGRSRDRDKARSTPRPKLDPATPSASRKTSNPGHVTGRELCESVRRLGLRQYGSLAAIDLGHWGVRSTYDIGEIVFHLIDAGDLEKTPTDSRSRL